MTLSTILSDCEAAIADKALQRDATQEDIAALDERISAARAALIQAGQARSRAELSDAVLSALYFSREAAALNPYDAEARYVRAEALAAAGRVGEALDFWRPIVEREFWNGANHDEYARLLLLEGSRRSLELAVREKPFVEDPALRRRLDRLGRSLSRRAASAAAGTSGPAAKPSK